MNGDSVRQGVGEMNSELKYYRETRDSGLEWLGRIPKHWITLRAKWIFQCVDIRSSTGQEELLTVSSKRGVVPRSSESVTMFKAASYVGHKLCWPKDLVVNSLWAWGYGLGVSSHYGIISSAYGVYRLRKPYNEYFAYIHKLVRSVPFNWELHVRSKGIWISRLQLTDESFLNISIPLPQREEQATIVRFLDFVDRRIQYCIRAKQRLIILFKEYRKSIIHHAVTRGLDPSVRLMPSGIESLGDIPRHWQVRRLAQIGTLFKGKGGNRQDDISTGIPCVRYGDLYTSHRYSILSSRAYVSESKYEQYTPIRFGDIIFAGSGETLDEIGKSAVNLMRSKACCGGDTILFRSRQKVHHQFLGYATDCQSSIAQKATMGRGITVMHIYGDQLKRLAIAIPPLPEQVAIASYLDRVNSGIDRVIESALQEISLLAEYRTRLIADVVTGKLDVREAVVYTQERFDESRSTIAGGVRVHVTEDEPASVLDTETCH